MHLKLNTVKGTIGKFYHHSKTEAIDCHHLGSGMQIRITPSDGWNPHLRESLFRVHQ
jgi:hypothetical protein